MTVVETKNIYSKQKTRFVLILLLTFNLLQSCVDLSTEPNQPNSSSKISIITPTTNGSLQVGNNSIIYSLVQPYSIKFIELYIDDVFVKNIPPNTNGTAPQVTIKFDSSKIGSRISLYLIFYDNDGTSSKSNVIKDITITGDLTIPFKPYNLSLIKFDNSACNVSWKDSSTFVEKYELWRKADFTGEYLLHQELAGNSFNTNDNNLDTNKVYFYKVRGIKSTGAGEFSDEINTNGLITSGNLYPASNLNAIIINENVVRLNWQDNSTNENYFAVERSTNNSTFKRIAALSPNKISYTDSANGLVAGTTYFYRIKSYSNSDSALSNTIEIQLSGGVLIAPSNLAGNYNSGIGVVELSWTINDNSTVYIDIERKTETVSYSLLRRVNASLNLFLDFSVAQNQNYTYRIRGYDLNTFSEYSNEVTISTN